MIDTTVASDSATGYYHRFSKTGGQVIQEKSTSFFGTWTVVVKGIAQAAYGDVEGPLIFLSNVYAGEWHLWVDDPSPQGYVPFETGESTYIPMVFHQTNKKNSLPKRTLRLVYGRTVRAMHSRLARDTGRSSPLLPRTSIASPEPICSLMFSQFCPSDKPPICWPFLFDQPCLSA